MMMVGLPAATACRWPISPSRRFVRHDAGGWAEVISVTARVRLAEHAPPAESRDLAGRAGNSTSASPVCLNPDCSRRSRR